MPYCMVHFLHISGYLVLQNIFFHHIHMVHFIRDWLNMHINILILFDN